ncbi:hypothetical protein DRO55_02105 [Candidatus Bathyarchaeota archaeon]|nr:MAG: hypothetical protein DRO55_02105 [Candidatus Bathyarchaeota archaeon]
MAGRLGKASPKPKPSKRGVAADFEAVMDYTNYSPRGRNENDHLRRTLKEIEETVKIMLKKREGQEVDQKMNP